MCIDDISIGAALIITLYLSLKILRKFIITNDWYQQESMLIFLLTLILIINIVYEIFESVLIRYDLGHAVYNCIGSRDNTLPRTNSVALLFSIQQDLTCIQLSLINIQLIQLCFKIFDKYFFSFYKICCIYDNQKGMFCQVCVFYRDIYNLHRQCSLDIYSWMQQNLKLRKFDKIKGEDYKYYKNFKKLTIKKQISSSFACWFTVEKIAFQTEMLHT
eukprot:TRINITY_DN15808_c0_g2_i2.p1 TRINITY_DN15808_c0_g2~~TRINITY_DN15808_c0_g2_i2.p1  ORF type:complete len:217 (-),score=-16.89 TRINITY_DN15808_c0_g2_i2:26-676(-)